MLYLNLKEFLANKQENLSKPKGSRPRNMFFGSVIFSLIGGSVYLYYYPEARKNVQQKIEENVPISKIFFEKIGTINEALKTIYESIKTKQYAMNHLLPEFWFRQQLHIRQIDIPKSQGMAASVSQIFPTKEENVKLTEQDLNASLKQANIQIKTLKQQLDEYQVNLRNS